MTRQSAQSFDAFAETYDRLASLSGSTRPFLESVLPEAGHRAVDLGCGTGHHAAILATRFEEVLGIDISPPMLEIARARRAAPNISYELRDLHDVSPEKDGRFDLVFSASTLHHVPDLDAALHGIRNLLNPGARVSCSTTSPRSRPFPGGGSDGRLSDASPGTSSAAGDRCPKPSRYCDCCCTPPGSTTSRAIGFSARRSSATATATFSPVETSPTSIDPAP
jgi:ubiquinone/menaquinone biosynthesis C-methylase UbiE